MRAPGARIRLHFGMKSGKSIRKTGGLSSGQISMRKREEKTETRQQLVDEIARYVELGFDELIIPDFTLGATFQERLDRYAELRSEVLSQLV